MDKQTEDKLAEAFQQTPGHELIKQLMLAGEQEIKKRKKQALRILIPAVIGGALLLIGIGILIGKYAL